MVSTYIDFKTKLEDNSIFNIFQDIKNGKYESEINSIRYAMHSGKEKLADELKSKLLGFTTSGKFDKQRKCHIERSKSAVLCVGHGDG